MAYVFLSGDPVQTGSAGDHNYEFISGEPLLDAGKSDYVFVSGTGVGGGSVVMNGTDVGFFETNETHTGFYNNDEIVKPESCSTFSDAPGLDCFGLRPSAYHDTHTVYVFVHRDADAGTYAIGYNVIRVNEPSGGGSGSVRGTFKNTNGILSGNPSDPVAQDDRLEEGAGGGAQDDTYGTDGNGDAEANHQYGLSAGDGVMFQISASSRTITFEVNQLNDGRSTNELPAQIVGVGPNGDTVKSISGVGTQFQIDLSLG